ATTSNDRTARLWDTTTGQNTHILTSHTDWVTAAAFSPDGAALTTSSNDGTARLWDTVTWRLLVTLHPLPDGEWAALLPDGRYKSSGGDVRPLLWWAVKLRRFELDELAELDPAYQPLDPVAPIPGLGRISLSTPPAAQPQQPRMPPQQPQRRGGAGWR
ncbi:WD40 repeat domain-containing protein, partial [Frankia sp. CiP1_Cm_nod2]|uniref:WD40 repeat domain-containing protein n=1 Tax=Frankia sp. CiP1_Cm_nod2 TaxID=2897161 RepID=UPI004043C162